MTEATRRRLATLGRVLAPIVLVAVVWRFVDLGSVAARLRHVDAVWAVTALLVTLPLYALYALRWSFTAARVGAPLSFRRAFAEYYVSTLLNQLLPLGVAGDVVRALRHHGRLRRDGATPLGPSARAVLLERMSGLIGLALFVLASAGAWIRSGRRDLVPVALGALGLLIAGAILAARRVRDVRAALFERGALGVQLALSCAAVALLVVLFVCAARATGVVVDWVTALAVVPLVLAATIVPFAFAGWGVREAATAALYRLLGLDAATGVAVSVAFGLVNLAAASPGLVVLALSAAPRSRA